MRGARIVLNQACRQLGVKPGEMTEDGLFTVEHIEGISRFVDKVLGNILDMLSHQISCATGIP